MLVFSRKTTVGMLRTMQDDVGAVVLAVHWLLHALGAQAWFEWIDSESNPADSLSRDGLLDKWTLQQPWTLEVGQDPPWNDTWDVHRNLCDF